MARIGRIRVTQEFIEDRPDLYARIHSFGEFEEVELPWADEKELVGTCDKFDDILECEAPPLYSCQITVSEGFETISFKR